MDGMIKLFENTARKGDIPERLLRKLLIYSTYCVESNSLSTSEECQSFYVPKNEYEFYTQWRQKIIKDLIDSKENAALLENIMRHHGL